MFLLIHVFLTLLTQAKQKKKRSAAKKAFNMKKGLILSILELFSTTF